MARTYSAVHKISRPSVIRALDVHVRGGRIIGYRDANDFGSRAIDQRRGTVRVTVLSGDEIELRDTREAWNFVIALRSAAMGEANKR